VSNLRSKPATRRLVEGSWLPGCAACACSPLGCNSCPAAIPLAGAGAGGGGGAGAGAGAAGLALGQRYCAALGSCGPLLTPGAAAGLSPGAAAWRRLGHAYVRAAGRAGNAGAAAAAGACAATEPAGCARLGQACTRRPPLDAACCDGAGKDVGGNFCRDALLGAPPLSSVPGGSGAGDVRAWPSSIRPGCRAATPLQRSDRPAVRTAWSSGSGAN